MSNLAHILQSKFHNDNFMEYIMNEILHKEYNIVNDLKISHSLINSAQQTISDLDKSIDELSLLVDNLRISAKKIENK